MNLENIPTLEIWQMDSRINRLLTWMVTVANGRKQFITNYNEMKSVTGLQYATLREFMRALRRNGVIAYRRCSVGTVVTLLQKLQVVSIAKD